MTKSFIRVCLGVALLASIIPASRVCAATVTANWNSSAVNTDVDASNPSNTYVVDITGDNTFGSEVKVDASGADVAMNVTATASLAGLAANSLHLKAASGRTITINIQNNLTFKAIDGSSQNFFITFSGAGKLVFNITPSKKISFTKGTSTGAAHFFVGMDDTLVPTVQVKRSSAASDNDATLEIGENAIFSFVATGASDTGTLEFYPANSTSNIGRMMLNIKDKGSFVLDGHSITALPSTIADAGADVIESSVTMTTSQGSQAKMVIVGGTTSEHAGLLILNENATDPVLNKAFGDLDTRTYDGLKRYGCVFGGRSELEVQLRAYLDYAAGSLDQASSMTLASGTPAQLIKSRNPSALTIDGDGSRECLWNLNNAACGVYFRAVADSDGVVTNSGTYKLSVTTAKHSSGAGAAVLRVEHPLHVQGLSSGSNAFEVLSTVTDLHGAGPLIEDTSNLVFPKKNFSKTSSVYNAYNNGYIFNNSVIRMYDMDFVNSDSNHKVFDKNVTDSEPLLVGGGTHLLTGASSSVRPYMALYNTDIRMHDDLHMVGMDFRCPNIPISSNATWVANNPMSSYGNSITDNTCNMIFHSNGRDIDSGQGRRFNLGGSNAASKASNGITPIDTAAYLDVLQTTIDASGSGRTHLFNFTTGLNNILINPSIDTISGETSGHVIYMDAASNIQVGTSGDDFTDLITGSATQTLTTTPEIRFNSSVWHMETAGGTAGNALASHVSGEGAMFVEKQGSLTAASGSNVLLNCLVSLSRAGTASLPASRVFFGNSFGIVTARIDMNDDDERIIVASGASVPDYMIDWNSLVADITGTDAARFDYYVPSTTIGSQTAVGASNVNRAPEVNGVVEQLQVTGTTMANRAHVIINGGKVDELIIIKGNISGERDVANAVLKGNGSVGIGSKFHNGDSWQAIRKMGYADFMPIFDGDGQIVLNSDIEVTGLAAILPGPNWSSSNTATIFSDKERAINVRRDATLDLSGFSSGTIKFAGSARLHMHPGSELYLGSGSTLKFDDKAVLEFVGLREGSHTAGTAITSNDDDRVKMYGSGTVTFAGHSGAFVREGAAVGVQTYSNALTPSVTFNINDYAQMVVDGGALQVGDTVASAGTKDITFALVIDGADATFRISKRGFFGAAAGIVDKENGVAPDSWLIGALNNVKSFTMTFTDGRFMHNQIALGSSTEASLMAFGDIDGTASATYRYDSTVAAGFPVYGGGNLANITSAVTSVAPICSATDDTAGTLQTSIFGSSSVLSDGSKSTVKTTFATATGGTAANLFSLLKTDSIAGYSSKVAAFFVDIDNVLKIAYLAGTAIKRVTAPALLDENGYLLRSLAKLDRHTDLHAIVDSSNSVTTLIVV